MSRLIFALILTTAATALHATETISYVYDEQGRLVTVVHSGTVNNGQTAQYAYDRVDNRVNVTVTGASH